MAIERNPFDQKGDAEIIELDTSNGASIDIENNVSFDLDSDGGVVVNFEEGIEVEAKPDIKEWFEDLADKVDDNGLEEIANKVFDNFESDRDSRSEWESMFERGFDLLGLKLQDASEPFEGACTAVHPLLIESAVKFQAKASLELFPAAGPVKSQVIGIETPDKMEQANRVQEFMNYQLTEQMPEYFDESERLLFHLPIIGSAFKKTYYDAALERPVSEFVPIDQFYVSYYASNLRKADRYTHVIYRSPTDLIKEIDVGMYRDIDLPEAYVPEQSSMATKLDTVLGLAQTTDSDYQYVLLEQHCYLELSEDSEHEEGVSLPYIVTLEEQSKQILSIRRNYRPDDKTRQKVMHFVHYKYVPGFGFYGLGLIHFLGNLTMTATAAMRALVDAGQFANLPGGFKAKGVRIVGDNDPISPGEFKEVEATGMDLSKSIVPLPYKEPSNTLLSMLNFVIGAGQKFADSTEQVVSDAASYGPVGTTMALLEASSKFFSAIHKRLHNAQREELKILAQINYDYLPNEYPFEVPGVSRQVLKRDFDGRVDIVPVSDPNIPSNAHRMMLSQLALQLAQQAPPGMFNMEELNRTILQAANMPNLDLILPPETKPKPLDPLSDIQVAIKGKPIGAFPGQNHDAHIQVKMSFMQDPMGGGQPLMASVIPVLQANIQEHTVMKYKEQVEGVALTMKDQVPEGQPITSDMIEFAMAQAAQQVLQANNPQMMQPTPEQQLVQIETMKLEVERDKLQAQMAKDAASAALKNRELDIDENEIVIKYIGEGTKEQQKLAADMEMNQSDHAIKAIETLLKGALEEQKLDDNNAYKAAELLTRLAGNKMSSDTKIESESMKTVTNLIKDLSNGKTN